MATVATRQPVMTWTPFDDEEKQKELLHRLTSIVGVDLSADALNRRPSVPMAVLADQSALQQFIAVCDWYLDEVRRAHG